VLEFYNVQPGPLLNKDINVKDNKQKFGDVCPARAKAKQDYQCSLFFRQASIAANPMLYCRFFFAFLEQKIFRELSPNHKQMLYKKLVMKIYSVAKKNLHTTCVFALIYATILYLKNFQPFIFNPL
jgi:hypothetical protein